MRLLLSAKGRALQVSVSQAKPREYRFLSYFILGLFPLSGMTPEKVRSLMRLGQVFWVAKREREFIGFLHFIQRPKSIFIKGIGVRPDFEGMGLGTALLAACEEHALQSGFTKLLLVASAEDQRTVSFYGKNGFSVVKTRTGKTGAVYTLAKDIEN